MKFACLGAGVVLWLVLIGMMVAAVAAARRD